MKSGFIPKDKAPDELIAGTGRSGGVPPDSDPQPPDSEPQAVA